jgi:hypothetical protein
MKSNIVPIKLKKLKIDTCIINLAYSTHIENYYFTCFKNIINLL